MPARLHGSSVSTAKRGKPSVRPRTVLTEEDVLTLWTRLALEDMMLREIQSRDGCCLTAPQDVPAGVSSTDTGSGRGARGWGRGGGE